MAKHRTKSPQVKWKSRVLLKDKNIERWYDNVKRGSVKTASVYLRRLRGFCEGMEINPQDLVKVTEDDRYHILLDFVSKEENRGMAGSYIQSTMKAVYSWLRFNRIRVTDDIRIRDPYGTPTLEDERVPTHKELQRVFLNATPRDRVCCVLMAHGGLRPNVIGDGNDGLMLKDFPEIEIQEDQVIFVKVPTKIRVRSSLSKAGHEYFTFLSEEGCNFLKEYLEMRIRSGETIGQDSDIISPKVAKKRFLSTVKVSGSVKNSLMKAGIQSRPYVLRSYFNTQLMIAESKGTITSTYRKFFFGHKGDMEARYSVNKKRLPDDMYENMRESYCKSQEFLQTTSSNSDTSSDKEKFLRMMFRSKGMSKDDIENHDLDSLSEEEMMSIVEELDQKAAKSNGRPQKIVSMDEAEELIEEGWEYIRDWTKGRVILKAP